MAKKNKKKKDIIDGAMDMVSHTDISDGVWDMFSKTGEVGYYLLYKSLGDNGNIPK